MKSQRHHRKHGHSSGHRKEEYQSRRKSDYSKGKAVEREDSREHSQSHRYANKHRKNEKSTDKRQGQYRRDRRDNKRRVVETKRVRSITTSSSESRSHRSSNSRSSRRDRSRSKDTKKRKAAKSKNGKAKKVGSIERSSSHMKRHAAPHIRLTTYKLGDYKVISHIADGTFGRCFFVEDKQGRPFAAKVVKQVKRYIESAKEEVEIIRRFNRKDKSSDYAPRWIESFYFHGYYVIITTMHGYSLYQLLQNNQDGKSRIMLGIPLFLIRKIARSLVAAVGFMHSIEMTHTDLKVIKVL